MKKLGVDFSNCYGIRGLKHEFDFGRRSIAAVYAPNGMMKTSFLRVFDDHASGRMPVDLVYPDRTSSYLIVDELGTTVPPETILAVGSSSESYASGKTSTLMVNERLRVEYERLAESVKEQRDAVLQALARSMKLRGDVGAKLTAAYRREEKDLPELLVELGTLTESAESALTKVPYKLLFSDKIKEFLAKPGIKEALAEYVDRYNELLSSAKFFRPSGFNHTHAGNVSKALVDAKFFDASHSVNLSARDADTTVVENAEAFNELMQQEKAAILGDDELMRRFEKIDTEIVKHQDLRGLRDYLEASREIVDRLKDLAAFERDVWVAHLSASASDLAAFTATYLRAKERMKEIADEAKSQETEWQAVVSEFHDRFDVPFTVQVGNQEDVILLQDAPALLFTYDDRTEKKTIDSAGLMKVLSTGEKRALFILNVIFEVRARIALGVETVLVLDDIADSFDYKNKYAIVEYLKAIADSGSFRLIILTHNFDFYRTVCQRLGIGRTGGSLMAVRQDAGIALLDAQYIRDPLDHWRKNMHTDHRFLIATIPMVRNLIEYSEGQNAADYLRLTAVLHDKPESADMTVDEVVGVLRQHIKPYAVIAPCSSKIVDVILELATTCTPDDDPLALENKVVLSIAIRILAERLMISRISDKEKILAIDTNQTRELWDLFAAEHPDDKPTLALLVRVMLMTPEAIHLNSFMYEPLLDMANHHLCRLRDDLIVAL